MVNKKEVLEYGKRIKKERPETTREEMRELLAARFIHDEDVFVHASAQGVMLGAVNDPIDWLHGLSKVLRGIAKWFGGNQAGAIQDVIDGVLDILF